MAYPPDTSAFKQIVLPVLLQKCPKNAMLSCVLPTTPKLKKKIGIGSGLEGQLQVKCPHGSFNSLWYLLDKGIISGTRRTTPLVFTHILRRLPSLVQKATRALASTHSQGCNQNWKVAIRSSGRPANTELHRCYINKLN